VVTKAKLDDIRIGGECLCGPAPKPPTPKPPTPVPDVYDPVALDLVILVDGSDSFNSTVKESGIDSTQFEESMDWAGQLVNVRVDSRWFSILLTFLRPCLIII